MTPLDWHALAAAESNSSNRNPNGNCSSVSGSSSGGRDNNGSSMSGSSQSGSSPLDLIVDLSPDSLPQADTSSATLRALSAFWSDGDAALLSVLPSTEHHSLLCGISNEILAEGFHDITDAEIRHKRKYDVEFDSTDPTTKGNSASSDSFQLPISPLGFKPNFQQNVYASSLARAFTTTATSVSFDARMNGQSTVSNIAHMSASTIDKDVDSIATKGSSTSTETARQTETMMDAVFEKRSCSYANYHTHFDRFIQRKDCHYNRHREHCSKR